MIDTSMTALKKRTTNFTNGKPYKRRKTQTSSSVSGGVQQRRAMNGDDDEPLERRFGLIAKQPRFRQLMPIKTRRGIVRRQVLEADDANAADNATAPHHSDADAAAADADAAAVVVEPALTTRQLLAGRSSAVHAAKTQIGLACRQLLEAPQEHYQSLNVLLAFVASADPLAAATIRKYATLSLLEVLRDLVPAYPLTEHDLSGPKLKKDTLALYRYENALIAAYRRYLVRLEASCRQLHAGVNALRSLALLSLRCLADCMVEFRDFNFGANICDALAPYLADSCDAARQIAARAVVTLFQEDRRAERSLQMVRRICQLIKSKQFDCRSDIVDLFLALPIKDVNLDREKEHMLKEKKLLTYKEKLKSMSRKERKRSKKLDALEKELTATRAEENVQLIERRHTDIVTAVFAIYFRIVRHMPRSQLMSSVLQGLAKFAHMINVDFFGDMLASFHALLASGTLAANRDALLCVQTVFRVLSGQGASLTLDPQRFYGHCYRALNNINPVCPERELRVALDALDAMLVRRRRKVAAARAMAFAKRLATLALGWQHPAQLATLALIRSLMTAHPALSSLIQLDEDEGGTCVYRPDVDDPEHCGVQSTRLYELSALARSYHSVTRELAVNVLSGSQGHCSASVQRQLRQYSPTDWLKQYGTESVQFLPPVPPPSSVQFARQRRPRAEPQWLVCQLMMMNNNNSAEKGPSQHFDYAGALSHSAASDQ